MAEPTLNEVDRRVAVLEQIAVDTRDTLREIRDDIRGVRGEILGLRKELQDHGKELRGDFRWLLRFTIAGFVGTWALLAHSLHWL